MTTAIAEQDAPPVPGAEEQVEEVSLPAGMSFEDFAADEEAETPSSSEPEVATRVAQPATPAEKAVEKQPEPVKKKGDVRVALKETREELKTTKARLKQATSPDIWDRIEAQRAEAHAKRPQAARQIIETPAVAFDRTKAKERAAKAAAEAAVGLDSFDAVARVTAEKATDVVLEHAEQMFAAALKQEREAQFLQRQTDYEYELRQELAEDGIDFEDVIARSGLLPMIQVQAGRPVHPTSFDQTVHDLVYGSPNQAKTAYRLAVKRLAYLERQQAPVAPGAAVDDDDDTTSAPSAATAAAAPKSAPPAALAEAHRAGARHAIEAVNEHATKPRGLRAFRNAGSPDRVALNEDLRRRLDRMADHDPEAFGEFIHKNPRIAKWWEDGGA
jgi:hypothetical protein